MTSPAGVVVNEFAPSGFGSTDEYVELRNTGNQVASLDGWELAVCLSDPAWPLTLLGFGSTDVIGPGGRLLLAHVSYTGAQSPDLTYGVDVPDDGGWLLSDPFSGSDGVGLQQGSACTEGSPAPECDWALGDSVSRDEDGTDSEDNATDFACRSRTPGF